MNFKNKVVLNTGSGSGMGEATAILFAREGADVVIADINEDAANKTAEKCKKHGNKVLVIKANIAKSDDAKNLFEKIIKEFGKLDILINNAGIIKEGNLLDGKIMETFDEVMNTNLRGVVLMTSLAAPYLKNTKGCIVNTSSVLSKMVHKGAAYPVYTMSKVGIDSFTRLSAIELAPLGVRVNAVNPGPVYTNLLAKSGIKRQQSKTALGKGSDPQEVADLIMYLASDKAKSITGSTYLIDNGMCLV